MKIPFNRSVATRRSVAKWAAAALAAPLVAVREMGAAAAQTPEASPAAAPSFADMLPESVRESGELKIAISLAYPPMEFSDPGSTELKGADIDLAREVAARLGLEPDFQNMEFAQLIPSLTTGRVDVIWTAMLDLEQRHEQMTFLDYFQTGDQFFAPAEFADQYETFADFCGETLTIATGTNWVTVVEEMSAEQCAPDAQVGIVTVPSLAEQLLQIKQKRAVGAMMGFEGLLDLQKREPDQWVKVGDLLNPGYYGIGFKKDNTDLIAAVEAALTSMIEDGTYAEILGRYGLEEAGVPEILTNAGK